MPSSYKNFVHDDSNLLIFSKQNHQVAEVAVRDRAKEGFRRVRAIMELELNLNPGQTRMGKVRIKRNNFPNVSYILVPLQYLLQNPVYYRNPLQVSMVTFELICFFLELEQEVSQILAKFDQSLSIFVQKLASSSAYNTNDYKPSTLCKNCRFCTFKNHFN